MKLYHCIIFLAAASILRAGSISEVTCDPGITRIRFLQQSNVDPNPKDHFGEVSGPVVPKGQVWKIKCAGIYTNADIPLEYMMQIARLDPAMSGSDGFWLCPAYRPIGGTWGTPALAIDREIILEAGEFLMARVNVGTYTRTAAGKEVYFGIMGYGWAFHEKMLPYLLGVPATPADTSTTAAPKSSPALDPESVEGLEAQLFKLKAM